MSAAATFNQMLIILLLMLAGYVCRRKKIVTDENNKCLSRLVLNVFNPAIIFSSMTSGFDGQGQEFWGWIFAVAALVFAMLIFLATAAERLFFKERLKRKTCELMFVFSGKTCL